MLKGIDPCLSPDLLATLAEMGHGDAIAVVDANFPAASNARRLHRADGVDAVSMVAAIVSLLPIDEFIDQPVAAMAQVEDGRFADIVGDFAAALQAHGYDGPIVASARSDFYEAARSAYAIVATGERRLYGNLIMTKGVIRPAAA